MMHATLPILTSRAIVFKSSLHGGTDGPPKQSDPCAHSLPFPRIMDKVHGIVMIVRSFILSEDPFLSVAI
jgi:hypothetical protein